MSHRPSPKRSALAISITGLLFVSLLAFTAVPVAAQTNTTNTPTQTATSTQTADQCQGTPQMSRTSIALLDDTITSEHGATVEANFRPEPTLPEGCTIIVDLQFSFAQSGFQFGGGANWDQATTNLVVTQFEVRPGEIRDIRAQLYTNGAEPGDEVTVIADYELWYKGDRDNSVQQSGIRKTIGVEATKTPSPADSGQSGSQDSQSTSTPAPTASGGESSPDGLLGVITNNLGLFMVFTLGLVAVLGLVKRKPLVQLITGGE